MANNNRDIDKQRVPSRKGKLPAEYNDEKFRAVKEELDELLDFYNKAITFYGEAASLYEKAIALAKEQTDTSLILTKDAAQDAQEKLELLRAEEKAAVDARDRITVDHYIVSREIARDQRRQEQERKRRIDAAMFASAAAKWFFRSMAFLTNSLKLARDTVVFLSQSVPPLNAVMLGMVSVVELFEALKVSNETPNRKVAKIVTSVGAVGFAIPAAVLALQGIAGPAAILVVFTTAMTVARDAFFIYKTQKDINKLLDAIAKDGDNVDPEKAARLATLRNSLKVRQNDCISNTFALAGAIFLTFAAAALTVSVFNPFVLGAIGTALLGISITIGARNVYRKHKARQAAAKAASRPEEELVAEHEAFKKKKRAYKKTLAASSGSTHEYEERQKVKKLARDKLNFLSNSESLIFKGLGGSSEGAVVVAKNACRTGEETPPGEPSHNEGLASSIKRASTSTSQVEGQLPDEDDDKKPPQITVRG